MVPITLCVDDYGLHPGVNEAAIDLARAGRVNAISVLVGGPAWREGRAALRELAPGTVDIGLHLDLTEYTLDGEARRPLWQWVAGAALRPSLRQAVRQEIDRQVAAFAADLGRLPAHVDGHRHVHQLPGIREELLAALSVHAGSVRPWLRNARPAPGVPWCHGKPWLLAALGARGLQRLARRDGWPQNAHLLGVYDFRADAAGFRALAGRWLSVAQAGDLWMCHPASHAPPDDPIGPARSAEYEVLAGPAFDQLLLAHGVRVQRWPRPDAPRL